MEKATRKKVTEAGNRGEKVRSDCHVQIETGTGKGLVIDLRSKVNSMFGRHIRALVSKQMNFYNLTDARVQITDSGALDFVIMARLEAAVQKISSTSQKFLPEMLTQNLYSTGPERFRLSRLYLPGNSPALMLNAGIHKPNGIILDLEDSVAPEKKTEARLLVRNALRALDFYGAERMVRINPLPLGAEDLKEVIPNNVHVILIPKAEDPDQITEVDTLVDKIPVKHNTGQSVYFMPILETAKGIENAYSIAMSSGRIVAMAIGLEDLTADLGVTRTSEGNETLWARSRMVNACVAAGIQPIDSVFSDVSDMEGLLKTVQRSKAMGFEGMGCIHPRQIRAIHEGFAPSPAEIDKAKRIIKAYDEAREKGLGVVSLGTKMIDPPVVQRALHILELAKAMELEFLPVTHEKADNNE
ncbi:MAG: citrate lyase ACP [Chlorobi bacterium]|nr:citrate lyase ACP [Chlorobiota bacterium]